MKVLKHLSQRIPLELGKTSITFSTATNRKKTVQVSKPLKTTSKRRDVIISSPPFNLVLVDLIPLCTVGSRMLIPTCVNSESYYYESWIPRDLVID